MRKKPFPVVYDMSRLTGFCVYLSYIEPFGLRAFLMDDFGNLVQIPENGWDFLLEGR